MRYTDRWGQSKITTVLAIVNVIDDFTLTPELMGFYSDPTDLTEVNGNQQP